MELFTNRGATTVSSGATDAPASLTQQNWTVASSATFPAASSSATPPTMFHVVDPALPTEIIRVTNVSGTTWTVIRGVQGTTPVAHASGCTLTNVVTGTTLTRFTEGYLNVLEYGLVNDGSTDNTSALNTLLGTYAPTRGGVIFFPPGNYAFTGTVTIPTSRTNLTLMGVGGISAGGTTGTQLIYSGTGSASFVSAQNTVGFTLSNLGVLYSSSSYSGRVIDLRNVTGNDTCYWLIEGCNVGGTHGSAASATGVDLSKAIDGSIRRSHFFNSNYHINGKQSGGYSNGISVTGCVTHTAETASIHNVGQGWHIAGNVFEGRRGGGAGAIVNDSGIIAEGCNIESNWMGDITDAVGGTQMDMRMVGTVISGNYIGFNGGAMGINVQSSSTAFIIQGNVFVSANTSTGITIDSSATSYDVTHNSYSSVTTPTTGGTTHGRYNRRSSTLPMDVVHNTSTSDGRAVVGYVADRTSTKTYHLGIDPDGSALKEFALRDITGNRYCFYVPSAGGFVVSQNKTALATTATDGFLYIPTCAGTPTGTPTAHTGAAPLVIDSTNNKLYAYIGGAWQVMN